MDNMPEDIEKALNQANEARLKIECAQLNDIYNAIKEHRHKFDYAYSILRRRLCDDETRLDD